MIYLKISARLMLILKDNFKLSKEWLNAIGNYCLSLFAINLVSLASGGFNNATEDASKKFLEILPTENFFYPIYEKIYLYIPAAFDFLLPEVSGLSMLILAAAILLTARRMDDEI
jgi:hypothetical protein